MKIEEVQYQVIDAVKLKSGFGIMEALKFRRLIYWLMWRDVKTRYADAFVGMFWALLQPLALVLILTVVLGYLVRFPSGNAPYSVFVVCGIAVWTAFSGVVNAVANSLAVNGPLLSKVYCSRLAVVISALGTPSLDAVFLLLSVLLVTFVQMQGLSLLFPLAILFFLWAMLLAFAVGLWFCALSINYRDFTMILPIFLQIGMFASPIIYPLSVVPEEFRIFISLNPVSSIVGGVRWAVYGASPPDMIAVGISSGITGALFASALYYFNEVQRIYADKT